MRFLRVCPICDLRKHLLCFEALDKSAVLYGQKPETMNAAALDL